MAIKILVFPIQNGDFPQLCLLVIARGYPHDLGNLHIFTLPKSFHLEPSSSRGLGCLIPACLPHRLGTPGVRPVSRSRHLSQEIGELQIFDINIGYPPVSSFKHGKLGNPQTNLRKITELLSIAMFDYRRVCDMYPWKNALLTDKCVQHD